MSLIIIASWGAWLGLFRDRYTLVHEDKDLA